jgi:anaerobic magnesium-protoporphyrin IX monomethyl ester cyclase
MNNHVFIIYPMPSNIYHGNALPIGTLYLAESLIKDKFTVEILDGTNDEIIQAVITSKSKDIIAFAISSMSGTQLKNSIEIAKALKKLYPKVPIILGGAHTTALPLQTLKADYIDYVIWGEGEVALPKLIRAMETNSSPAKIKGIGYKSNGRTTITKKSDYTDLNRVFNLPYHLLDMTKYSRKMLIGPQKNYFIFSSRGCPYNCHFCSNSSEIWPNNEMRYHTTEHIINDISVLVKEYGADGITFGDENFFINRTRLTDVCNAIIENGFNKNVKFRGSGRADFFARMPEYIWQLLKDSGFIGIAVGLESGSQSALDNMGKRITLDQIYRTDELLTEHGFYKTYNFMVCTPKETIEDIKLTMKLITDLAKTSKYCPYPFDVLHQYIPLPGTRLFNTVVQEHGFKSPSTLEGWTNFDFLDFEMPTEAKRPWVSKELIEYVKEANRHIESLNALFIGKGRDDKKIDEQIEKTVEWIKR